MADRLEMFFTRVKRHFSRRYFIETDLSPREALNRIRESLDHGLYLIKPEYEVLQGVVKGNKFDVYWDEIGCLPSYYRLAHRMTPGSSSLALFLARPYTGRMCFIGSARPYGSGARLTMTGRLSLASQVGNWVMTPLLFVFRSLMLMMLFNYLKVEMEFGRILAMALSGLWDYYLHRVGFRAYNDCVCARFELLKDIVSHTNSGRLW